MLLFISIPREHYFCIFAMPHIFSLALDQISMERRKIHLTLNPRSIMEVFNSTFKDKILIIKIIFKIFTIRKTPMASLGLLAQTNSSRARERDQIGVWWRPLGDDSWGYQTISCKTEARLSEVGFDPSSSPISLSLLLSFSV